jgi:hypothetical protein
MVKICTKCGTEKDALLFYKRSDRKSGINSWCISCEKERNKKRPASYKHKKYQNYVRNIDKYKSQKIYNLYGITLEEKNKLEQSQGGVCAICKQKETLLNRKTKTLREMPVDHSHKTGKIRGILCSGCNTAIGLLKENPEICIAAAEYLRKHENF